MTTLNDSWYLRPMTIDTAYQPLPETLFASPEDYQGKGIALSITEDGAPLDTSGCTVLFAWHNLNSGKRNSRSFSAVNAAQGRWKCTYPTEMLTSGKVRARIVVTLPNGGGITSSREFDVIVEHSIANDLAGGSSDDMSVWQEAVADLQRALSSVGESVDAALLAAKRANDAATSAESEESGRISAELLRIAEETERAKGEADRIANEAERQKEEQGRVSSERQRREAESARAADERTRCDAEASRRLSQEKNNADQINNNLMAQANRYVRLNADQYDHATGAPTIAEPRQGITYLVPSPREGTMNNYDGWAWLLDDDGSGMWELIGPANPTPDTVTTDDIDAAIDGPGNTGMRYMALNAINYMLAKLKTIFAPIKHSHDDFDINALDGSKLTDASVSRAKIDAGFEADISELETFRDSVSQHRDITIGNMTDDGKITYWWDKTLKQVQIRVIGWTIPQGAMYSAIPMGQWFPPPYAPTSTVFVPLSVDIGYLGAIYVDNSGNVYLSRRSDIPASGATCYGAVSWGY